MNISHLLLCTSLLAAPVCAAQGLTETETETPASASRLPAPQLLPGQAWWLVCRIDHGSLLWYADDHRPAGVDGAFHRRANGPWLPLDAPASGPWLQVQAGVLDPEP